MGLFYPPGSGSNLDPQHCLLPWFCCVWTPCMLFYFLNRLCYEVDLQVFNRTSCPRFSPAHTCGIFAKVSYFLMYSEGTVRTVEPCLCRLIFAIFQQSSILCISLQKFFFSKQIFSTNKLHNFYRYPLLQKSFLGCSTILNLACFSNLYFTFNF